MLFAITFVLVALGIIGTVGFTVFVAGTPWALLGLVFLCNLMRQNRLKTTCPACDNIFTAIRISYGGELPNVFKRITIDLAFVSLAICGAVVVAVHYFHTSWALLALCFIGVVLRSAMIRTTCPKCEHYFHAIKNLDNDD